MQIEKVIARASWIPLLIVAVALLISFLLGIDLLKLFFPDFYLPHWHHNEPASSFFNAMGYIVLFGAFLVAVVGEIILIRHGYGSKKFWKHTTIWYAVFVVLTVGITILEGMNYNQLTDTPIIPLTIAICLYPVIALLELMLVMSIARWVKKQCIKNKNISIYEVGGQGINGTLTAINV